MKTKHFNDRGMRYASAFLFITAMMLGFAACSNDNDVPDGGGNVTPEDTTEVYVYDDLDYFQNAIIEVDTLGEFVNRNLGEVLNVDNPEQLFVPVENLSEAKKIFLGCLAPDVEAAHATLANDNLQAQLTDMKGQPQGTVYFTTTSGADGIVAEMTASSGTKLLFFNKVSFMLKSAWPYNSDEQKYFLGDVITHRIGGDVKHVDENQRTLRWVCIREAAPGVKPMFCATTKDHEFGDATDRAAYWLRTSRYCPSLSTAKGISEILREDWDGWVTMFEAAGNKLNKEYYWIDRTCYAGLWNMIYKWDGVNYSNGKQSSSRDYRPFLLKIDWLEESEIECNLSATDGCSCVSGEGYHNLFDMNNGSKWCSLVSSKKDGVWFIEFNNVMPIYVTAYNMKTAYDTQKFTGRNPKAWKLYGKNNSRDEWTLIDTVTDGKMPNVNCYTMTYDLDKPGIYTYFRLEVSSIVGNNKCVQFGNFSFVYEDI